MPPSSPSIQDALFRKLETVVNLTSEERKAIERLPAHVRNTGNGETLLREGDRPSQCCLILSGLACRQKFVGNGHRQIMSFHILGDLPDLQSLYLDVMDHEVAMLRSGKVAFISHVAIRELIEQHPRMGAAFGRHTLIDAAIFRAWMVNIGRRSAHSRVAHLLCELVVLARVVGLGKKVIHHLPTQEELGDALGLSIVHINRTMRHLRDEQLIATEGRQLSILDWKGLQRAGEFDPAYLHLKRTVVGG